MNSIPQHVAIILDGNRRYAGKLMMKPWKGHEFGARKIEEVIAWAMDLGVKELTLFCFSMENFSRSKEEFDHLMALFKKEFERLGKDERIEKHGIRICMIGKRELFPKDVQAAIDDIEKQTSNNSNYTLNLAMAYGGRAEILDAARKMAHDFKDGKITEKDLDEDHFSNYLYINSEPDMIIRTGGVKRISNFLLWQGNYSELFFFDKLWPEFTKEDFSKAIEDYKQRKRNFGK